MSRETISEGLGLTAKLYIFIYVAVMYSGSTFLAPFVMPLICVLILMLIGMAKVKGVQRLASVNRCNKSLNTLMVAIILFLIYQLTFSYNPKTTLVFVERFVVYSLLFVFVASVDLNYKLIKAIRWYSFPVAISILLTTLINGSKSGGLVGNYQFSGMMMSISFGVFLINYYYERNKWDMAGLVLSFTALFASGKRSFTLICIIAYVLIFLHNNNRNKVKRFFRLSAIMVVAFIVVYVMVPPARLVVERVIEFTGDTTYNGRTYYWIAAGQIFADNRFQGIGMGCFSQYFDAFFHRLGNSEAWDAHNVYVQMAAELGLIGEGLFILLFVTALIKSLWLLKNIYVRCDSKSMYVLTYSIFLQGWFILYCFTGNPLYGAGQFFFYIGAIAMMLSVKVSTKKELRLNLKN